MIDSYVSFFHVSGCRRNKPEATETTEENAVTATSCYFFMSVFIYYKCEATTRPSPSTANEATARPSPSIGIEASTARGRGRGRPPGQVSARKEVIPRGHGVYVSPFTNRVFDVCGDRARVIGSSKK